MTPEEFSKLTGADAPFSSRIMKSMNIAVRRAVDLELDPSTVSSCALKFVLEALTVLEVYVKRNCEGFDIDKALAEFDEFNEIRLNERDSPEMPALLSDADILNYGGTD